ncbi:MAG: hypothetical protein KF873_10500, partial [Gemmataceae bacterium]|nr:hypothetical protein [Gemmataceae bacterium]
MAEKTVRVAVIGRTGKGNYGHGLDTIWLQVPNVEIVAIADENEKGLAGAVAKLKAKAGYADYKEMLAKEKPAARTLTVADEMVAASESHQLEKPVELP